MRAPKGGRKALPYNWRTPAKACVRRVAEGTAPLGTLRVRKKKRAGDIGG